MAPVFRAINQSKMEYKDNLLGVVETVFKWKKFILVTCILTAVGASIVALLMPVYYKSTSIFYAASPDLAIPEVIFGESVEAPDYYGTENDIDRILSIANSNELAGFMIDSFNLYEHYDIDPNSKLGQYTVRLKFGKHFDVVKTKYDAIELSIEDQDKELAARMTNTARDHVNFLAQKLIRDSQKKLMLAYEGNTKAKESQLKTLNDSLQAVRLRYGVYNTLAQSEGLSDLIAKAEANLFNHQARLEALQGTGVPRDTISLLRSKVKGYENELLKLNERLNKFNQGMAQVEVMKQSQLESSEQLAKDMERYKQVKAASESDFPTTLLLEAGTVPVIKSRPKRSLIVAAAVAVAFVFSVIGAVVFDTYRDVNWREVLHVKA